MLKYPYIPKSNKFLEVGEYWPIKLENQLFAYGVVLKVPDYNDARKMFLAGLINWIGTTNPSEENFDNKPVHIKEYADAHIKTIMSKGEKLIGKLQIDPNELNRIQNEYIKNTWGYNYINLRAEKLKN